MKNQIEEIVKNVGKVALLAVGLAAASLTVKAQGTITYSSDELVFSNLLVSATTNANTLGYSNLVSANYPQTQGFASTIGLSPLSTITQNETFELYSAQFAGTNGVSFIPQVTGTNYLALQYALYMDDFARAQPGVTNIPGTTIPLPPITIPIAAQVTPPTNYWTVVTNSGTITTNKLFYSGVQTSMGTLAASNFYGAKWYRIVSAAWVATNNPAGSALSIFHLRGGHWAQGIVGH